MLAAVEEGDVEKMAELMGQDPDFNVNKVQDRVGRTLLHHASCESDRSAVIPLLRAHPDIDVNMKDSYGMAPFYLACWNGPSSCVRLLEDSRVKVNETDAEGFTPLFSAVDSARLDNIKWWIASGREMDLGNPRDYQTDAIGMAKKEKKTEIATLLERFKLNPEETRYQVRVELDWYEKPAAEMFALAVFVSDGLLQINETTTPSPAARFFSIARQLPLELQMVLCHRLVGSAEEIIPGKESEVAFKNLAMSLMWSSIFTS